MSDIDHNISYAQYLSFILRRWGGRVIHHQPCRAIGTLLRAAALAAFPALATGGQAAAQQQSTSSVRPTIPPTVVAAYAEHGAPRLDGRLDDAIWQQSTRISEFTQVEPQDGAAPTERTEVLVAYDDAALYVAARMYSSGPHGVTGRLGRRDSYTSSDLFTVVIDSYHDHRTAFRFRVNPKGVRSDDVTANDDEEGDESWDPVWDVATRIDSLGWIAEIRIPFSQLRFSAADEQIWGINFTRLIFAKNEFVRWSWAPNTEQGFASQFGHLNGLRGLEPPRRLELLPYVVTQSDHVQGADPDDPFNDGSVQSVTGGLDLKYGVTSELTLDATVNPDFGQVEADPAVVNLTAFETYFEERRPFFVEGANIFQFGAGSGGFVFGAPELFYSRRVGRSPSRTAFDPEAYVDNPTATRILGAAKLSGKTGGWSIGFLDALTRREYARVQVPGGEQTSEAVEPLSNYGVLSVRKDLREGATGLGFLSTVVVRDLNDPVFTTLRSSAFSGGADFFHRFADNQFAVSGTVSGSYVRGDTLAIAAAQLSSARYYQRPDQDYVSVDRSANGLAGYAASVQLGKVSGNWVYGTDAYAYSPGFEINDAGFQTTTDRIFHGMRVTRRWLSPGTVFRRFSVNSTFAQVWNFGGTAVGRSAYLGAGGQLRNYWQVNLAGEYSFTTRSDKATRGGPLMESPASWSARAVVETDDRKPVTFGIGTAYARNRYGGWGVGVETGLAIRPSGAVSLSLGPAFERTHAMGFYVTQRPDSFAVATYGGRYLFSELEQTSLDLNIRLNVALTPDLSIQLWAQPFLASGDYLGFKELSEPGTFHFLRYGTDGSSTLDFDQDRNVYVADPDGDGPAPPIEFTNPDFSVRSLRSNLVVRWEYVRGSTLFLVWNHGRVGSSTDPTFRAFAQLGDLWQDDAQNTFLIKVNYWLSR
jgi:hypothetical protein